MILFVFIEAQGEPRVILSGYRDRGKISSIPTLKNYLSSKKNDFMEYICDSIVTILLRNCFPDFGN